MDRIIHGGDIYRNQVTMDFSVNGNPLGMAEDIRRALEQAVDKALCYPDITGWAVRQNISRETQVPPERIVCGNGASELFLAIVHALQPKKVCIPVPSFYGYERAAEAVGAELSFYEMQEQDGYCLTEKFLKALQEDTGTDMVFLANPNNPVGNRLPPELVEQIGKVCEEKKITLVLDECFLPFTGQKGFWETHRGGDYPHVLVAGAYTKIYAIPGVRLGYLLTGSVEMAERIGKHLPEWNLSCFAQTVGEACWDKETYLAQTISLVEREREYLREALAAYGIKSYESDANFLLLYTEKPFYEALLQEKILIRDCRNYRGLGKGYYRIAVRSQEENRKLMEAVGRKYGRDCVCKTGRD